MNSKTVKHKTVKRIARVFSLLLILFLGLILFVRSPWGQDIIVKKVIDYVFDKTGTEIDINRVFVTFTGDIQIEGFYLQDKKRDTLLYSKALEVDIDFSHLLFKNTLELANLEWQGVTARILRNEDSEKFNFTFLQEAFAPQDSAAEPETAEPFQWVIGNVSLKDFDVHYTDKFLGIESIIICGNLLLEVDQIDLSAMHFAIDNFEIYNTQFNYTQKKAIPTHKNATTAQLPNISIAEFRIENVQANYGSIPDNLEIKSDLSEFSFNVLKADIANASYIIEDLNLNNSEVFLKMEEAKGGAQDALANESLSDIQWPELSITVSEIEMENNRLHYGRGNTESIKGVFNPDAISLQNFCFVAKNLKYEPNLAGLKVEALSFLEKSGFLLQNMTFESHLGETGAALDNFSLNTAQSSIEGTVELKYSSIDELFNTPRQVKVEVKVPNLQFDVEDAFYFQSALSSNTFSNTRQHLFKGQLFARGTLEKLKFEDTRLQWGDSTSIALSATMTDPMDLESLSFDIENLDGVTSRSDVLLFISEKDLGITIPKVLNLHATAQGKLNNFDANAGVKIPEGTAQVTGNLNFENSFDFQGTLDIDSLQLNKLLKNEQFGTFSLSTRGSVTGNSLTNLKADFSSKIPLFQFDGYNYTNASANGKINNGNGIITLAYKDENLDFNTTVDMHLDTTAYDIKMGMELKEANLRDLNLASNDIGVRTKAKVFFKGTAEDFDLRSTLSEGVAVVDNKQYRTDDIELVAHIDSTTTQFEISSSFLNGNLDANGSPEKIIGALKQQFQGYFDEDPETKGVTDSVKVQINTIVTPEPILTEAFFKGLQRLDTIAVNASFNAVSKKLYAVLDLPSVQYQSSILDSLKISLNGDAKNLDFSVEFGDFKYNRINIKKTLFEGSLKNKQLLLDFVSFDEKEKTVHLTADMGLQKDSVQFHINPKELIFNKKNWSIPADNRMIFAKDFLHFEHVILSSDNEKMELTDAVPGIQENHFGLLFENYGLQSLLGFFNPDEALASGILQGRLILENPYGAKGLIADLTIDDFALLTNRMGKLSLNATSNSLSKYTIDMALKDGGIDLDLNGNYTATEQGADLDIDMDLQKLETQFIQGFFSEEIAQPKGYLSAQLKLSGTSNNPVYDGQISFHETAWKVVPLNVGFKIDKETLVFDDKKFSIDQFDIEDAHGNLLTLDGSVRTSTLSNPSFDLSIETENFSLLNARAEDNNLYYGIVRADANVQISGDRNLPVIRGETRIRKGSELTYVVPEEKLDIQERDGVVIFVNSENADDILTGNENEVTSNIIRGLDIDMAMEIDEDVVFNIVLDQRTDDRLQVQGEAALNLNLDPNGIIGLVGRYELNNGFYQTNLYNLVSRKFDIKPGSSITWSGDPFDAKLDVTAIYQIETSPAPLMTEITSGIDTGLASTYQDKTPFMVYLNVKGEFLDPSLSFALDIPKDDQSGTDASVYGAVQRLNEQESELNKQVFSLLAFNRFFPTTGSDGGSGGGNIISRNNVNQVLSGELNAFSNKIFENSGFELDFDLDSFTDYRGGAAQDRTKLNINAKDQFFNERLIVSVGSSVDVKGSAQPGQKETPIIGNVSLEYLLTNNGRYRLKGYQKSEYTNIIDGQLIVSGLALIFDREFNEFSELFRPSKVKEETDQKSKLKKKKEKTTIE